MELKACPNCGKKVLSIAKVCKHCAYSFANEGSASKPQAPKQVEQQPAPRPQPQPAPRPQSEPQRVTPAPITIQEQPSPSRPAPQTSAAGDNRPKMFSNLFGISGRIRRKEYLVIVLICSVLSYIPIVGLLALWLMVAASIKRCHDINLSGWFCLIPLFGLVLLFVDTKPGENEYGPNPKY